MSFHEENGDKHKSSSSTIRESKDEFIYVSHACLSSIEKQVSDLKECIEHLFGNITKEVDRITFKLRILEGNVIQLTDFIRHKIPNEGLSMQDYKSRQTFSSMIIQSQQVYSSTSFPIQSFERNKAKIQIPLFTLAAYQQDDMKKLTQNKKNLDNSSQPETVQSCQLMKDDVPMVHNPAVFGKVPRSYVYQPSEYLSFSNFPFDTMNNPPIRWVILPGHPYPLLQWSEGDYCPYVIYGIGKAEVVKLLSPAVTHHKPAAFVNPIAPEAPLLPTDRLALLRASKGSDPPDIAHSPVKSSSSPVLEIASVASPADCLQTTDTDHPVIPPNAESCLPLPEPFEYHELTSDDTTSQGGEQRISPSVSPLVISTDIQSWNSDTELSDSVSVVQPPKSSDVQSLKPSFEQSPRPSIAKPPISSLSSKPRSAHRPQNFAVHISMPSTAPLSKPSTLQNPRSLCPVSSVSSHPQKPVCSNPLPRHGLNELSRHRAAQPRRSPVAKPTRHLHPPQSKSSLNSTKISTLQSSSSFQSLSFIASPNTLSVFQCTAAPVCTGMVESSPILPIVTKARKALMEAIRRGVLLRKTKDRCAPKEKMEISKNELDIIQIRRKAMGYNSGISDSEVDWIEEK